MSQYRVSLQCRQRGAIGKFEDREFIVTADNSSAANKAAFNAAQGEGWETGLAGLWPVKIGDGFPAERDPTCIFCDSGEPHEH